MSPAPTRYTAAPSVVATELADEVVLLDSSSGAMFALSGSGRTIWTALEAGTAAAAAALLEAYDVSPEQAAADVAALVGELLAAGLLVERRADDADA